MDRVERHHRSLGESVTEELRTAIVSGALAPGDRLVEDDIADRFGVSRMPVREALSILQIEGFVDIAPRRGATVATISPAGALQLFEVRAMLEGLAARLAARRKDQADFQHLVDIVDSGRRAATENHQAELAHLHRQFHVGLAKAAANRYLIDLAAPLPAKIDWIFSTSVSGPSSISWNDHSRILEVLFAGDEALAEQIARRHVEDSAEEYLKLLAHGGLDLVD